MIIGILGLGYVGLPLAISFGNKYLTIGFDLNQRRMGYIRQDGFSSFWTLMKNKTVTCGSSSSDTSVTYKAAQDGLVSGFYWLDNNGNMLCE